MLDKKSLEKEIEKIPLGLSHQFVDITIALIEIRESVDRYIEQRIKSDKVLEGVLRDIYSSIQESGSQN